MTNINKAITATIRSISEKKNLIFSFNNKMTKVKGNTVFLPNTNLLFTNFKSTTHPPVNQKDSRCLANNELNNHEYTSNLRVLEGD